MAVHFWVKNESIFKTERARWGGLGNKRNVNETVINNKREESMQPASVDNCSAHTLISKATIVFFSPFRVLLISLNPPSPGTTPTTSYTPYITSCSRELFIRLIFVAHPLSENLPLSTPSSPPPAPPQLPLIYRIEEFTFV